MGGSSMLCLPMGGDTACVTCLKNSCCMQITACENDVDCAACLACVQTAMDPTSCLGNGCSLSNAPSTAVLTCAQSNCANMCP
jgi:hypothetical protein